MLVELLRELVEIESPSGSAIGVEQVGRRVIEELEPLGFVFERHASPSLPHRLQWVERLLSPGVPYEQLGPSYVGQRPGSSPDRLLLLGDLDTAFPEGSLKTFPFSVRGTRAYGPGVADMKGGLVVLIAALKTICDTGLDTPSISVVLSGDEQAGSLGSAVLIKGEARIARWCLCVECARRGGKLMAARGHIGIGRLVTVGKEAHAGSDHTESINALDAMARIVSEVNELTNTDEGVFVTVTMLEAGKRRSVVPGRAEAVVDIRTPEERVWKEVEGRLRSIVNRVNRAHPAVTTLDVHAHRPGVDWDHDTDLLLGVVRSVGRQLGLQIEAYRSAAAGSSAFATGHSVVLDGMGPKGGNLMTNDEYIDLTSLVERSALLALTIHRLADPESSPPRFDCRSDSDPGG